VFQGYVVGWDGKCLNAMSGEEVLKNEESQHGSPSRTYTTSALTGAKGQTETRQRVDYGYSHRGQALLKLSGIDAGSMVSSSWITGRRNQPLNLQNTPSAIVMVKKDFVASRYDKISSGILAVRRILMSQGRR